MGCLPERPETFFRLNPAAPGKPECFAVRRGQVREKLFVNFWKPHYRKNELAIDHSHYPVTTIGQLVIERAGVKDGPGGWLISASEYTEDGVPIVRAMNVSEEGKIAGDFVYISEDKHAELSATEILPADLLLTMRGSIGRAAIVPDMIPTANINAAICRIRLQDKSLNEFIRDYLNCPLGRLQAERHGHKAVQGDLNLDAIRGFRVIMPPKGIRDSLVAALEADRARSHAKLAQAEALLSSIDDLVLAELGLPKPKAEGRLTYAVRLDGIKARLNAEYYHPERVLAVRAMQQAKGWLKAARLDEIADFIRDIVKVSEDDHYLGLASIESNTGEITGQDEAATGLAFTFHKDDVLFSRLRPYLNKVRRAEEPGICSTEFHVMRIKEGLPYAVLPEYLACILRSSPILAQTRRMMTGNTHPRLANEDVVNLVVPIPNEKAQRRIVDEVAKRKEEVRRARAEAATGWAAALAAFEAKLIGNAGKA